MIRMLHLISPLEWVCWGFAGRRELQQLGANKIKLWNNYNADSQSLAKKKKLGEKTGCTNLHKNATKSSLTALWRFYCKVFLLVTAPLVREAEPGGVVRETKVGLFSPLNQFQSLN